MNEQAKVGLVVLVTVVLLTAAGFAIANMHFGGQFTQYHTYFKFGGGLEVGAPVRFAGLKVGRVNDVHVDPQDKTRVEVMIEVAAGTPVAKDSVAQVTQLTMLSENYVEITPNKETTPLPNGSVVPSAETQTLNTLIAKMSGMADQAQPLIADLHKNLNEISARADKLLANLQEVTGEKNQQHLASILSESDGMIKDNRPKLDATMNNLQTASAGMAPLLSDLREATAKMQKVMDTANGMLEEDRPKIAASIDEMQKTLATARATIEQLQSMLVANGDNLDMMLDNFRQVSDNFREFTDTVKRQPSSLIWKDTHPDRKPPSAKGGNTKGGKDERP
jgi:phospholipid/cholesterol/gamma-HCH transport system substrate-binding protein